MKRGRHVEAGFRAVLMALAMAVAAGCGDGSSQSGGANIPDAGGIHESQLEEDPTAELNLTHTVVIRLEACGTHPGDTHTEEGVDEIPYFFAEPTDFILSVAEEEFDEPVTLVLLDGLGMEVARVEPGGDSEVVTVSGPYTVRLEHSNAGECDAEPIIVFLRPFAPNSGSQSGASVTNPLGRAATDSEGDGQSKLAVGGGASLDPCECTPAGITEVATLNAGTSCVCCDLSGIRWNDCEDLEGEPTIEIDGINLAESDFENADLECVQLTDANMNCAVFDNAFIIKSRFSGGSMLLASFRNASVSGTFFVDVEAVGVDFTGATLTSTGDLEGAACLSADLSFSSFVDATLSGVQLNGSNFTGSDLEGAILSQSSLTCFCAQCPFGCLGFRLDASIPCGALNAGVNFGCGEGQCANLSGVTFEDLFLRGIDFTGAMLNNATFPGSFIGKSTTTPFKDTVFKNADLSDADFSGTDLSQANLSNAFLSQDTNFVGATLSVPESTIQKGANLACDRTTGTGLCEFTGTTQFAGANLQYVDLTNAGLAEADLRGAILDHAVLNGADLNHANLACDLDAPCGSLDHAVLNGANLSSANLAGASLTGTFLQKAKLPFAYMPDADLTDADLTGAHLENADFYKIIGSPSLEGATLSGAHFDSAKLIDLNLNQAKIEGADFSDALMLGAQLRGITHTADTNNDDASFVKTLLAGADFSNSTFNGGVFTNAIFSTSNMTPVTNSCTTPSNPRSVPLTVRNSPTTEITQCYNFAPTVRPLSTSTSTVCPDGSKGPCITDAQWVAEDPPIDEGFANPNVW